MDPVGAGSATPAPDASAYGPLMLSDVMGRDRSINIFAGLTRDVESIALRLDDASQSSTVLAPLNSAMDKLPRKPWEDQGDYNALGADVYEGGDGQERARRNLRRFAEAHIVPSSPWPAGHKVKTISGDREIWWEEKDGVKVVWIKGLFLATLGNFKLTIRQIQPDNIGVVSVASKVSNGQVWIIKGALNSK